MGGKTTGNDYLEEENLYILSICLCGCMVGMVMVWYCMVVWLYEFDQKSPLLTV